jgi:hypothetical protein
VISTRLSRPSSRGLSARIAVPQIDSPTIAAPKFYAVPQTAQEEASS